MVFDTNNETSEFRTLSHNLAWYFLCRRVVLYSLVPSSGTDVEMSAVEVELDRLIESEGKEDLKKVKDQQLALFKALTTDISEPTSALVAKLNCETKCLQNK